MILTGKYNPICPPQVEMFSRDPPTYWVVLWLRRLQKNRRVISQSEDEYRETKQFRNILSGSATEANVCKTLYSPSPLHLVVFLRFYDVSSSGTQLSAFSFWLTFCHMVFVLVALGLCLLLILPALWWRRLRPWCKLPDGSDWHGKNWVLVWSPGPCL